MAEEEVVSELEKLRAENEKLRRMLTIATDNVFSALLRYPKGMDLYGLTWERMQKPQPGDFVMETSTSPYKDRDEQRFGRLLRVEERPLYTEEEWKEGGGDEPYATRCPKDPHYIIEKPDGSTFDWWNCSFLVVIESRQQQEGMKVRG